MISGVPRFHPTASQENSMHKIVIALLASCFLTAQVQAQAPAPAAKAEAKPAAAAGDCEAKAVGKNGKPLAGAAKTAFMKKCEGGSGNAGADACAAQATEKKLAGAAKTSFLKKCHSDAKAAK
jgi:hypothetical protein